MHYEYPESASKKYVKVRADFWQKMLRDYDGEQERLKLELEVLEESVYQQQDDANAVEQFKRLAAKYLDVPELTPTIVNEYIQKIIVHAPEKDKGIRTQRIQYRIQLCRGSNGFAVECIRRDRDK